MRSAAAVLTALVLLSGCAAGSGAGGAPTASAGGGEAFRSPSVQRVAGLDGVIGARADTLLSQFGPARIDLSEGDVRKLQFAGRDCVLDIFLYPMSAGAEPVATHVEARRRQDGQSVDKARCLAEISTR